MKFGCTQNILKDKLSEKRTVRKFLLFPRSFESKTTRWLEYANIVERVEIIPDANWCSHYGWVEKGFADEMGGGIIVEKES